MPKAANGMENNPVVENKTLPGKVKLSLCLTN
jgi:hypothetical protein